VSIVEIITISGIICTVFVSIINLFRTQQIHLLINSRLTELLTLTRQEGKIEGIKEELARRIIVDSVKKNE
jgi:hypothetical protein